MRMRIGDVSLYFDVDGCQLVPAGPDMVERPTVIALHGGPGADHSLFKPVLRGVTEFAQVIYLDQRGSGRSGRGEPETWTWERWADDVIDFCDALEIADPVLLGTSSGGWVALTTAIRHPGRMGGLVLDSVMPGDVDERLDIMERLGGVEARGIARRYWDGEATDEIREAYAHVCVPLYSQRSGQDTEAADRMHRIRWNPEVLEHFRQAIVGTFDPWPGLDRVTCPTMILAGEHDPVATVSAARRLAAELPGTRLHVLPGAGHGIFREDPARACALLQEFVMGNRVDADARMT